MSTLDIYRNMLRYADSAECPVEDRMDVIEGAQEIINAHYKEWADGIPNPYAYDRVKKEAVGYMDKLSLELSLREKSIRIMRRKFSSTKYKKRKELIHN